MELQQQNAKKNKTIQQHADDLIEQLNLLMNYGYIPDNHIYYLVKKACLHHDDGKANPEFQKRVNSEKKISFNPEKEIAHNILSVLLLDRNAFESLEDYYCVAAAILYHHDFGEPIETLKDKDKIELAGKLLSGRNKRIKRSDCNKLGQYLWDEESEMHKKTVLIKGLLHKCDYSASGGYQAEFPNDFLVKAMDNVKKHWPPQSDWNALQKYCMKHRDDNLILIAQTGMGKTEAGLQWIGDNKGFFVLPIRTAINAIYQRVSENILENQELEKRLALLHSSSMEYYVENIDDAQLDYWEYEQRGKNLAMPLSISTMDQLFDFVFRYAGYEFKLATFSYSKLVIDEIQMYDPNVLAYLIFGLKKIKEMGGKIAIMTATLAPFLKDILIKELSIKPEHVQCFSNDLLRHNVKVIDEKLTAEAIAEFYKKNKSSESNQGNKILVVCNTVKKAQAIYGALKESLPAEQLHLLHSRFTRNDRAKKEEAILAFGKTYNEDGSLKLGNGIWIATSLVEASLDIDFDYLFTELQELNSLFQRLGRCNRKGVKPIDVPNCFIYTEIEAKYLSNSTHGFIDVDIYNVSKEALKDVCGPITETQKMELIDKYMTMEKLKKSEYIQKYNEKMMELQALQPYDIEKKEVKIREIDTKDIIPHTVYELHKDEIEAAEKKLNDKTSNSIDRLLAKQTILGYSVSVYNYEWINYSKAMQKDNAQSYSAIKLGTKAKIDVMECHYSQELGYTTMKYEEAIREAIIF